jgi:cyclopropane fatty-acyl-phospholipid synthase-like methyltransferase
VATRPADDPTINYRDLVRRGYDACAELYAAARRHDDSEQLADLLPLLPNGSQILDLGCGAGVPITLALSERHNVTGVDASRNLLHLAEAAVPNGRFILGDIMDVHFDDCTFDAAVAMFVLFHLPRDEQGDLLGRVHSWLRPGGYFLATLTEHPETPYTEDDFFGVEMFWSNWGWPDYERLLRAAGFELMRGRIIRHGYGRKHEGPDERHPMVLARKR